MENYQLLETGELLRSNGFFLQASSIIRTDYAGKLHWEEFTFKCLCECTNDGGMQRFVYVTTWNDEIKDIIIRSIYDIRLV